MSDGIPFLLFCYVTYFFFPPQVLIPKLKEPDPNPGVVVSVLAAIGEQAQVNPVNVPKPNLGIVVNQEICKN